MWIISADIMKEFVGNIGIVLKQSVKPIKREQDHIEKGYGDLKNAITKVGGIGCFPKR